jgi:hypothetical protein
LLWLILWCLLDRWLRLVAPVRLVGLLVGATLVIWIILRAVLRALFRTDDWIAVAADIEKRRPAFAQRLLTVVSEAMYPRPLRAADGMLQLLVDDVAAETQTHRPTRMLPWRRAIRPWITTTIIAIGLFGLTRVDWLQMPTLARRLIFPTSGIPPVTTTALSVAPGDVDVIQGESVEIAATVERLIGSSVELYVSHDGRNWSSAEMAREGDGGGDGSAHGRDSWG